MTRGTPTRDARRMNPEPASGQLTSDDVVLRESTPDDTLVLDTFSRREVRSEHDYYDDDDLGDGHRGASRSGPRVISDAAGAVLGRVTFHPVSYTHLTLPTKRI